MSREMTFEQREHDLEEKLEAVGSSAESLVQTSPLAVVKPPGVDDEDQVDEGFEDGGRDLSASAASSAAKPLEREALRRKALDAIERRRKIEAERFVL